MTKEEYKKNLIRMFDSLRTEYKGEENCRGVKCDDCPLFKDSCYGKWTGVSNFRVYKAIEIVENWAKEHPVMTNADKFKEVFGFGPLPNHSILCADSNIKCEDCEYFDGTWCKAKKKFWNTEYKEKK